MWRGPRRLLFMLSTLASANGVLFNRRSQLRRDDQHVLIAVVCKVSEVKPEGYIAAEILPDVMAIEHHYTIAKHAVELDCDALSRIRRWNCEHAPVPTDARFWILAADWFCSMVEKHGRFFERKLNGPVVQQVDAPPATVIKIRPSNRQKTAGLGELQLSPPRAQTKIFRRVISMSQLKTPTEIQQ